MSIRSRKKSDAHLQIRGPDVPHEYERRSFLYDLKMCVRQRWLKTYLTAMIVVGCLIYGLLGLIYGLLVGGGF